MSDVSDELAFNPEFMNEAPTENTGTSDQHGKDILSEVKTYFDDITLEDGFAGPPADSFIDTRFFDFEYLSDNREIERKWVNKPYTFVSILESTDEKQVSYRVSEPELNDFEEYVLYDLLEILRSKLMYVDIDEEDERSDVFHSVAKDIITDHVPNSIEAGTLHKLFYYLSRDFVHLGPIDPLMRDPKIEDISCDGIDIPLYIYHFDHRDLKTNLKFNEEQLKRLTLTLAHRAGEHISVSQPLKDGSLPDGSRVQLTFDSDISTRGPNFTIRKFSETPYTPIDLIKFGTFSIEQMAYFWLAIENNRSLIFTGGTASGKTTSMNAVSFFIPENAKIVSIEDTREFSLPHENWIQSLTRESLTGDGQGEVGMYQLLQTSLRQRPEYLLVGEIRTDQQVAYTFFQAIGTGHTAYTTIHAESMKGVLNRLQNDPLDIPTQMLLDLDIVSIQSQTHVNGTRVRRNKQVSELLAPPDGEEGIRAKDVFNRNPDNDKIEQINDSSVLKSIANSRGWDDEDLVEELALREEFLRHLLENDIAGYREVAAAIHAFNTDRQQFLGKIRSGESQFSKPLPGNQ